MAIDRQNLRNAILPCPFVVVMKPSGRLYPCEYAQNRRGGAVEMRDGKPRLRDKYADAGYRMLDEIADNDEQKKVWPRYFAKARELKGKIKPLPEKYLPKACKVAKAQTSSKLEFDVESALRGADEGEDEADRIVAEAAGRRTNGGRSSKPATPPNGATGV